MSKYVEIEKSAIPNGVRFDVPGRLDGQMVERAYGGFSRAEHDDGDPYKRVTDRTTGVVKYYKRVD